MASSAFSPLKSPGIWTNLFSRMRPWKSFSGSKENEPHHDLPDGGEQRIEFIIDAVPALISYVDPHGIYRFCNHAYSDWFGLPREEVIGKPMWDVLGQEAWNAIEPHIQDAFKGRTVEFETQAKYKSGGTRWIRAHYTPDRDATGKVIGIGVMVSDISQRKQAEEALRQIENRKSAILDAALDAIITMDHKGNVVDFNPAAERIFGYRREDVIGKAVAELIIPEPLRQRHYEGLARYLASGHGPVLGKRVEMPALHADGHEFPVELSIGRIVGTDPPMFTATLRDISERKQAEIALRESEKRFRSFVEATAHVIWRTNSKGEVDQPIPSWCAFTGQSIEESFGFGWMNAIHPDDRPEVTAAWQKASAAKAIYEVEYRLQIHSGEWRNILARGVPVLGSDGEIIEYIGSSIDVTERKLAEESTRESEERFRQLAENIPQLAWMTNADGWIFWYNKRWFEYTGTTLEQMQGWGWQAVHHPEHLARVTEEYKRALTSGEPWEDTFPLRSKDGQYRWFLSRAFPIHNAEGKIIRWFGTNTDIEELRLAQESLTESEARYRKLAASLDQQVKERTISLEDMNQQLEAFTYTIAHDLRAPLRAQQSFASALLEDCAEPLGEIGRDYAQRIMDSAKRMNNLLNDLLEYSRISRTELRTEKLDLRKIVSEVCDEMASQVHDAKAKIHLQPFDFYACGHEVALRTAVTNLIANAIKFSKPNTSATVRIYAEKRDPFIRLWVEDNGIGIAPEHHHQIFGIFNRLNRAGDYAGTGVGLAIVQKGVERMGGRVGVESQEGKGSRFWIELEKAE